MNINGFKKQNQTLNLNIEIIIFLKKEEKDKSLQMNGKVFLEDLLGLIMNKQMISIYIHLHLFNLI